MKKYLFICLTLIQISVVAQDKPNILWIVTEDISPDLSMYGDTTAKTPALDALAAEGTVYENTFSPVGVCAPTRSAIITGMYPTSIGTMHMRTGRDVFGTGRRTYDQEIKRIDIEGNQIPLYAAVVPEEVKCFPEYLRAAGYFTSNNAKTDYQFAAPVTAWNQNGDHAHWRNRKKGQPFFSVFNIPLTHESKLWMHEDKPLTVKPNDVKVPPYLLDNETTRKNIARHYSNIELMDKEVMRIIDELKADGLYDNTIIFFYSDHGGPLPREKRAIYDSGLHVPMIVKDINSKTVGRNTDLVSFVDLGPTLLSLAGIKPSNHFDGNAFMGAYKSDANQYIFGSSDRFDEYTDRSRAIRTKDFLYVKNFHPELPKYKDVGYRKNIPAMVSLLEAKEKNTLNDIQQMWFETKTTEELYDVKKDPYQLNNLALNTEYADVLKDHQKIYKKHEKKHTDYGAMVELDMVKQMWPNLKQPQTSAPKVKVTSFGTTLTCNTKGASIAYIFTDDIRANPTLDDEWQLYSGPITKREGKYLYIMAERIGFKESEIVLHSY